MDLDFRNPTILPARLFDNLQEPEHKKLQSYAINRIGDHLKTINLGKDESTCLAIEFALGSAKISRARIQMGFLTTGVELNGPVN
jgi:hypothetical protein